MTNASASSSETQPRTGREMIGRVVAVSGSQITVGLSVTAPADGGRATVGKFLGIISGGIVTVGMITEISERPLRDQDPNCRSTAQMDLVGEIRAKFVFVGAGGGALHLLQRSGIKEAKG